MSSLAGLLSGQLAFAWGHNGHELIGAVADTLIAGKPAAVHVQQAALWADCARNVTDQPPNHYVANPRFPECQIFESPAEEAEFESYVQRNLSACHPTGEQQVCHKQYHFADVALERDSYDRQDIGTSDHDVVSAIQACIAVLQGQPAPAPFDIHDKQEALRLLAHFAGDVHQPLHVGAIYLDVAGQEVDPDKTNFNPDSGTRGGNLLKNGSENLHSDWDLIPASLRVARFKARAVMLAAGVSPTSGNLENWPLTWATDTVIESHKAFQGVRFGVEASFGNNRHWSFTAPRDYAAQRHSLQKEQLVKAGARLAQLLEAIWP